MAINLNVATSIIDWQKSRGFQGQAGQRLPFYKNQQKLYEALGLQSQYGEYRGNEFQNPAIIRALTAAEKGAGVSITPENVFDIIGLSQRQAQTPIAPGLPPGAREGDIVGGQVITPEGTLAAPLQAPQRPQIALGEAQPPTPAPTASTALTAAPETMPADLRARVESIFKQPSPQELANQALEQFFGKASTRIQQEAVGAEKAQLELGAQREKESFIRQIASRGLIFSGAKTKGLTAIDAEKVAKMFNVDKNFALLIAQGLESSAQDVAREAQKGSQQALQSLERLGFTVNPLTNRVEPTLEAQRFVATEARQLAEGEARERRFQETQERLAGTEALREERFQQTQAATEKRFQESQAATEARFRAGQAEGSVGERKTTALATVAQSAQNALDAERSRSQDGFANPNTYRRFKTQYINAGGSASNFLQALPPEVYIAPPNRKGDLTVKGGTTDTLDQALSSYGL